MFAPDEQESVARASAAAVNQTPWDTLRSTYTALADVATINFMWANSEGNEERSKNSHQWLEWRALRSAMIDGHGAWFSATLVMSRAGSYEFDFNYTDPVNFAGGVDDQSYILDMARFPRPWDEIPEWHPVKMCYTPESWAAELAQTE